MTRARPLLPFLAVGAGIAIFSMMDAVMKSASIAAGVYSAVLLRNLIGSALMALPWLLTGGRRPRGPALRIHVLRSAVVACMAPLFFWGLVRVPMAEAMALSFIAPLIALYLAAAMLGETIRRSAVAASLVGLAGVVVIAVARLDASEAHEGAAVGIASVLLSAMLYAWNLVLQRRQAQLAQPLEVAGFMNTTVLLALAPFAPWFAQVPDGPQTVAAIAAAAVLAMVAGMLFSWAYARAEAQALVPVEYSAFVWAALLGWLVFGERLTWPTLLGTALVVAACWIAAPRRRPEQTAT